MEIIILFPALNDISEAKVIAILKKKNITKLIGKFQNKYFSEIIKLLKGLSSLDTNNTG